MKYKLITRKDCPFCEKIIYLFDKLDRAVAFNQDGTTFWVLFNDGTNAEVACCKQCSPTKDQIDKFMQDQIWTWGQEIISVPLGMADFVKQLEWYINTAVHLRIVKTGKTKDELIS